MIKRATSTPVLPLAFVAATMALGGYALAAGSPPAADDRAVQHDAGSPEGERKVATTRRADTQQEWGVIAFRSAGGRTCLAAGPVKGGHVGRFGRGGFRALRAEEAPANCGVFEENFAEFGGIAMVHGSLASPEATELTTVVYGLVPPETAKVALVGAGPSQVEIPLQPVRGVPGASAAFVAPIDGPDLTGLAVEFTRGDGRSHRLDLG